MKSHYRSLAFFPMLGILTACAGAEPERSPADDSTEPPVSLQAIMVNLGADADRLARALWIDDFETVAAAARAIADHPHVPEAELQAIVATLGADFAGFVAEDRAVHDIAIEIEATAVSRPGAVSDGFGDLAAACVRCHAAYRERLRPALAAVRSSN